MNEARIQTMLEQAADYGIKATPETVARFKKFAELLVEWNEKINLTAILDDEGIAVKHFLDSLTVLPYIKATDRVIDIGTGGGFPGIPLAIANPDLKITLLDSLDKRIRVLHEIVDELGLKKVRAEHGRAEEYGVKADWREKYDIAVSRAVANLPVLLEYCLPFVREGGYFIAMKGPDAADEIKTAEKAMDLLGGELVEVKTFLLPGTDMERNLLIVKKVKKTPRNYPRKSGKPSKEPIL
jgi:16S rRNA (guanine527-N7)-methyltransferase